MRAAAPHPRDQSIPSTNQYVVTRGRAPSVLELLLEYGPLLGGGAGLAHQCAVEHCADEAVRTPLESPLENSPLEKQPDIYLFDCVQIDLSICVPTNL